MKTKAMSLVVLGLLVVDCGSAPTADPPKPAPAQPATASRSVFFLRDVMPLVTRLGCNSVQCHGAPLGKGGMPLSMFGGDAEEDYETIVKDQRGTRIDRMDPAKSLLLLKVTGGIPHGGAQKIPPGSAEYKTLLAWIEQGAPYSDEKLPKLVCVQVLPPEQVVQKGQTQQLAVTAVYSDGTKQDVTRLAVFQSTDAKVASVDADGKVKAEEFGSAAIVAIYLRQSAVVRLRVPQPLATPFPTVAANNKIDELVFANLKALGFPPSEVAADEVFLRRVFFDVIGTPPTPDEARAFLADKDPQKRSKLIDRLLEREEFADFAATKWRDLLRIKAEDPISLWPKACETYYRWVRESIAAEQALRPVRPGTAHRQRQQFPRRAGQLRAGRPRARPADPGRGHGLALPGGPALLRPLPRASGGELGKGRRPGDGRVLQPGQDQVHQRVEGADRLPRPGARAAPSEDRQGRGAEALGRGGLGRGPGKPIPAASSPTGSPRRRIPGSPRTSSIGSGSGSWGGGSSTSPTTCGRRIRPRIPPCWSTWRRSWSAIATT